MSKNVSHHRMLIAAALSALASASVNTAMAVPVNGLYIEDSRCDVVAGKSLTHELGDQSTFPTNEALKIVVSQTSAVICVANDGIANDWVVQMTNVSGQAWNNLFFVANSNINVGNADGSVVDFGNAAILSDAFRIDGTVTPGSNNSLVESGVADEIFSPGETWRFLVTNFQHPSGVSPVPGFYSPGAFAGTTSVTTPDTASILATPYVPEPSGMAMLGIAAGSLLLRRRR